MALCVVPRPAAYFAGGQAVSNDDVARSERKSYDHGQSVVDKVSDAATAGGVKAQAVVTHSDSVAESIMATARRHKCDLVVMASHGRKGIKRVLLGSETQHVLTHSTVPVLVLR